MLSAPALNPLRARHPSPQGEAAPAENTLPNLTQRPALPKTGDVPHFLKHPGQPHPATRHRPWTLPYLTHGPESLKPGEVPNTASHPAKIQTAFDLPDPEQRSRLSDWLLMRYSNRDPWAAFQIYQDHRSEFGGKWGADTATTAIRAACAISGEKAVETMKAATQEEVTYYTNLEYPPGFDFRTVLDYLVDAPILPQGVPENLRSAWAAQDPAAAAGWLAHHPPLKYDDNGLNAYSDRQVIAAVAASDSPGRAEALASLATLPDDRLEEAWKSVTNREAALDPLLLDAATATGHRDTYLIESLLNTRNTEVLPPSWSSLPEEDRTPLIDRVLSQWEKDAPTPVAAKARDHWRAAIEKQWASLGK